MHDNYKPTSESPFHQKFGYLMEEAGEIIHAGGKSLRWGLESVNPELPESEQETNREWLLKEIQDLKYAILITEAALRDGENF